MPQRLLASVDALGFPEIGRSSQGRAIRGTRLGGQAGAPLLVVGGLHGDEPSSLEAVVELGASLAATAPAAPVWVVPVLNPDGLALGRKNTSRDVDLNRSFPARSFTVEHRPGYFPGARPLDEPEARVLADLVEREGVASVVAVHAPLACVNFDGPAEAWAGVVSAACGWPVQADIGYPTPGSLGAWLGVDGGLPVLTLELPPGPYAGFREAAQAALEAAIASRAMIPAGIG